MSSLQVKAALQEAWLKHAARCWVWVLFGGVWFFFLFVQLKIKLLWQNTPLHPVLQWFHERCTGTGTNNIQAEMYFEAPHCAHVRKERYGSVSAQSSGESTCSVLTRQRATSSHGLQAALFCRGLRVLFSAGHWRCHEGKRHTHSSPGNFFHTIQFLQGQDDD